MTQQTAVEWLYHKLSTCSSDEMVGNINNWFEQAKQMEIQQLKEKQGQWYHEGFEDGLKMKTIDEQIEAGRNRIANILVDFINKKK